MFKIESYKRGIVLSTIFNVFNKGLVFINGLVVAYFFGATHGTDIFFYTYNTLIILSAFFMNTNSAVIIPESMRIRASEGKNKSIAFLNFFIVLYTGIILLGLLLIVVNPISFFLHVSSFSESSLFENRNLLYLALPLFGMACLITLFIDILTSYKYFTVSMMVGIINGATSILLILCLHGLIGIESAFIAFISSYSVNICVLIIILRRKLGWKFLLSGASISKRIWKNLGFAQLGNLLSSASLYTPMYILSGYNAGIITALTFAQQISALPNALITTQFSSVAGIKFNELIAHSNTAEINRIFSDAANLLHFILIPLSCLTFFYAPQIVGILADFTSINAEIAGYTITFLKYLGFLSPFYVTNTLISRLFMASHKIRQAFWFQAIFNIVLIGALYFSIKRFGILGYPASMIVIYCLATLSYYFIEKRYFRMVGYDKILKNFMVMTIVNIIISVLVFLSLNSIGLEKWTAVTLAFTLQLILLLTVNRFFDLNAMVSAHIRNFVFRLKFGDTLKTQKK